MHLIVPMAGAGRRFKEAGYTVPKPLIKIGGRHMIEWALDPIPPEWNIHLVLNSNEIHGCGPIGNKRNLFSFFLWGPTQGAACTVLAAALALPPGEPVAVMNADQWFRHDLEALQEQALKEKWDGYVLTFRGEGDRWSYVREVDGWITEVAEKKPISVKATVGFYWWRHAQDLVDACCILIAQNHRIRGEFYLAPTYNEVIERYGAKVKAVNVDEFKSLGTPEDVESFEMIYPMICPKCGYRETHPTTPIMQGHVCPATMGTV